MNLLEEIDQIILITKKRIEAKENLDDVFYSVLGRKGELSLLLRKISSLSDEDKKTVGAKANLAKIELTQLLTTPEIAKNEVDGVDYSYPASNKSYGSIHPISAMIKEMTDIFRDLSFDVALGNEIVTEEENFDMLNFGVDHPARDCHDSLTLGDNLLLRTHTTAVQVIELRKRNKDEKLPVRIVVPGKTFRRESDPTHSLMFHQMDAVLVDDQTTLSDLKGIFAYFIERLFGPNVETRFRPHYFPFTEPSAELDILWTHPETGEKKWLEVAGCGMIHPNVLKNAGINSKVYQGWAFGMSIERPLMIRHQIKDIRLLYSNSLNFLNQFNNNI